MDVCFIMFHLSSFVPELVPICGTAAEHTTTDGVHHVIDAFVQEALSLILQLH